MAALSTMKRLLNRTSSKQPTVHERPASADGASTSSTQSPDGSVIQTSEPTNGGHSTPTSSVQSSASAVSLPKLMSTASDTNVPRIPHRPVSMLSNLNRRSVTGLPSHHQTLMHSGVNLPNAMYTPRLTNVEDQSQVVLLRGVCGDPKLAGHLLDGTLRITYDHRQIPRHEVQVVGGVFKFMAYLIPGNNAITLEFFSIKLKDNRGPVSNQSSVVNLFHIPLATSPPLRLAILAGSDSPGLIDNTPERIQVEGNDLGTAVAKFRMAAQMSQAACAELMRRQRQGGRAFRLEEEWTRGTISRSDNVTKRMRQEPKVHLLRADHTVAELQDLARNGRDEDIMRITLDALDRQMDHCSGQTEYVAVLILDSYHNASSQSAEGHVWATAFNDDFSIGIMGSQFLYSIPSVIEDIDPTFQDCTRLPNKVSADGIGTAASIWDLADLTLSAQLRLILRLFGVDGKVSGLNSDFEQPQRDNHVSRLFASREPFRVSEKSLGLKFVATDKEPELSLHDALQMRFHPSFATILDQHAPPASRAFVWPVKNGEIIITSSAGILYYELFARSDKLTCGFQDFTQGARDMPNGHAFSTFLSKELTVNESKMRLAMGPGRAQNWEALRFVVHSFAAEPTVVPDASALFRKNDVEVKNSKIKAFRSMGVGKPSASKQEVIWNSATDLRAVMKLIKVYHDSYRVYGIETIGIDSDRQLFGTRGEMAVSQQDPLRMDSIELDFSLAETVTGLIIWTDDDKPIQGIQFITSKGARSRIFGSNRGCTPYRALVPRSYTMAGFSGTVGASIDSMSLIIKM